MDLSDLSADITGFSDLNITQFGGNTFVGTVDSGNNFQIKLAGEITLTESDFVFA